MTYDPSNISILSIYSNSSVMSFDVPNQGDIHSGHQQKHTQQTFYLQCILPLAQLCVRLVQLFCQSLQLPILVGQSAAPVLEGRQSH